MVTVAVMRCPFAVVHATGSEEERSAGAATTRSDPSAIVGSNTVRNKERTGSPGASRYYVYRGWLLVSPRFYLNLEFKLVVQLEVVSESLQAGVRLGVTAS